jgi:hypothetical protein
MLRARFLVHFLVAAATLALWLPTQAAWARDGVPQLDVEPSCRAAAAAAMVVGRTRDNCHTDEKTAREAVAREWDTFSAADRRHCHSLVTTGGPPSYVEFLSCLEVSRDARKVDQERSQRANGDAAGGETTGAGK